jgi:hypothetical protein
LLAVICGEICKLVFHESLEQMNRGFSNNLLVLLSVASKFENAKKIEEEVKIEDHLFNMVVPKLNSTITEC